MRRPIVVGFDGTESSLAALRWAFGAADVLSSEVAVATVGDAAATLARPGWEALAGDRPCRTATLGGDPRLALLEFAAKEDAALLVLGAGGTGWFPALHLGSVSHHVAQHTDRPVCVVPATTAGFDARRVLVGLDGSRGSAAAGGWGAELARAAGGTVLAVHGWQHAAHPIGRARTSKDAADDLEKWCAPIVGTKVERIVEERDPAALVAAVADRAGAGVVVIGTRGAGGFHDLRLGSVALRLLQHAHLPTVLVPPD